MARARSIDALEALARVRWAGAAVGRAVPCRSNLIGREVELRVRGQRGRQRVAVEACAVPKSIRTAKGQRPDYLVRELDTLFPFTAVVDGGTVRNATRTPRPTHPAGPWEFLNGQFIYGPREAMNVNRDQGLSPMAGLDVPYPHRVGSHICCPDHAANADELAGLVRDEYETEGVMARDTRRRLGQLAAHLARHHGATVPATVGPEDWAAADQITTAGTAWCAAFLSDWQESQEQRNAEYRVASKKKRAAAKSKARRAVKASSVEAVVGVKAKRYLAALSRRNAKAR